MGADRFHPVRQAPELRQGRLHHLTITAQIGTEPEGYCRVFDIMGAGQGRVVDKEGGITLINPLALATAKNR